MTTLIALDDFAGTGWGVACKALGIEEYGVELMDEAVATREANGMTTLYRDVWEGFTRPYFAHDIYIASPPCQTFSLAGSGKGRAALDEVLGLIRSGAYRDPDALRAFGERHDERTSLVLTPLAHVFRDRPRFVVFEQVPPVLPVWEACADVMAALGYSVATGLVYAEQYGVPQTRKRAVLVARLDGVEATLPRATHSRYYSRTPEKLDEGVLPWVSMAEALGWARTDLVGFPRRADRGEAVTIGGIDYRARDLRPAHDPSQTVTEKARSWSRFPMFVANKHPGPGCCKDYPGTPGRQFPEGTIRLDSGQASALQSYPTGEAKRMGRGMVERYGDRPGRSADEPSFTVRASAGGTEPGGFVFSLPGGGSRKVTAAEASILQAYPDGFQWKGSKSKQFLQIGNAVPPLLAYAILAQFVDR